MIQVYGFQQRLSIGIYAGGVFVYPGNSGRATVHNLSLGHTRMDKRQTRSPVEGCPEHLGLPYEDGKASLDGSTLGTIVRDPISPIAQVSFRSIASPSYVPTIAPPEPANFAVAPHARAVSTI